MPPPRPNAGQASAEYVALLAVVCAVVAGAAAVGSVPPIAAQVASAVKHGICRVAGGICTPAEARAAGLAPCLTHVRSEREQLGARVLVFKVGRDDALLVQRRSDGSASVSFADGAGVGASAGLGAQLLGRGVTARAGAGLQFTAGRSWEFPTFAAAARFVRRWGRTETLGGELRGLLPGGDHPPPPDSTYKEGGAYGEVAASIGLPAGLVATARHGRSAIMGRRIQPGGRVTWYGRVEAETAARLGLVLAAVERHDAGEAALEITTVHGRATELRLRAAAGVHGDIAPAGPAAGLSALVTRLRGSEPQPGGKGRRLEVEVALDLTDPANRRALAGFFEIAGLGVAPADWDDRVRALSHRIDVAAAVDVRLLRVGLDESDHGADAVVAGGSYDHTEEVRDLERAWSLPPGGVSQEREDCIPA